MNDVNDNGKLVGDQGKRVSIKVLYVIKRILIVLIIFLLLLTGFGISYYLFIARDKENFLYRTIYDILQKYNFTLPDYYDPADYDLTIVESVSDPIIWDQFFNFVTLNDYVTNYQANTFTIDMFPEMGVPSGYEYTIGVNNYNPFDLGYYEVYVSYTNTSAYQQDLYVEFNFFSITKFEFNSITFSVYDIAPGETIDIHIIFDANNSQVIYRNEDYVISTMSLPGLTHFSIVEYFINFQVWIYDENFDVEGQNPRYKGYRVDKDDVTWYWVRINGTFNEDYLDPNNPTQGDLIASTRYILYEPVNSFEGQMLTFMFMGTPLSDRIAKLLLDVYELGLSITDTVTSWTLFIVISILSTFLIAILLIIILLILYLRNADNVGAIKRSSKLIEKIVKKHKQIDIYTLKNIYELNTYLEQLNEEHKEEILEYFKEESGINELDIGKADKNSDNLDNENNNVNNEEET